MDNRLVKMLAKAFNNSSREESATALSMAKSLMKRDNLSFDDLFTSTIKTVEVTKTVYVDNPELLKEIKELKEALAENCEHKNIWWNRCRLSWEKTVDLENEIKDLKKQLTKAKLQNLCK